MVVESELSHERVNNIPLILGLAQQVLLPRKEALIVQSERRVLELV
jgi:hypothetical protein